MTCIAPRCTDHRQPGSLFCRTHEAAPPGKRGGWLSAERRRQRMGGDGYPSIDASNIARRLWIGSSPPFDRPLPGFDILVLCAREHQPDHVGFRGTLLRCPLPDDQLTAREISGALVIARVLADRLVCSSARILVTCADGRNRSALVAGLAVGMATTMPPDSIVSLIRRSRSQESLNNQHFVEVIERYLRGRGSKGPRR